ncbi:hypothetical protein [Corynebacterium aquilae]|uniref:Uncharacterized protein n=1 Tax=Corynebacterium aquilae DSM 44791 TaxID=1431546 RepID=A0A1L7CEY6_9CORY|nr:hypothetical protein [Corynebacterium aquilae]APT84395.1 hypothetical protein CAQU_04150 [Corynebacterium aquilae DSM 44791]
MSVQKLRKKAEKGLKKKKCCKSKPRCKGCPVVLHRLCKQNAFELDDKALKKAIKKARQW